MQYLVYGGVRLLTGDAAAEATLSYCAALAQSRITDVVRLPVVDASGARVLAAMVLGPAIAVLTVPGPDEVLDVSDTAFVRDLEMRTAAVQQGAFSSDR